MTQVRWEVWRRLYALADDPVRQKLNEQYARIEEFYEEVTKMPVSLDWSHENFNAYNPCRHSERASLTARALATLEEIRLVTVQWNIEPHRSNSVHSYIVEAMGAWRVELSEPWKQRVCEIGNPKQPRRDLRRQVGRYPLILTKKSSLHHACELATAYVK